MGPRPTRNCAVLELDEQTLLFSFLKSDIDRKPLTENRVQKITCVSATKEEGIDQDTVSINMKFWGQKAAESRQSAGDDLVVVYQGKFQMPSSWTPNQFLGALYVLSKDRTSWVIQTISMRCGPVSGPFAAVSDVACAFAWSKTDLDSILQRYGGTAVVTGGRE